MIRSAYSCLVTSRCRDQTVDVVVGIKIIVHTCSKVEGAFHLGHFLLFLTSLDEAAGALLQPPPPPHDGCLTAAPLALYVCIDSTDTEGVGFG
jgi:hypothetical protein